MNLVKKSFLFHNKLVNKNLKSVQTLQHFICTGNVRIWPTDKVIIGTHTKLLSIQHNKNSSAHISFLTNPIKRIGQDKLNKFFVQFYDHFENYKLLNDDKKKIYPLHSFFNEVEYLIESVKENLNERKELELLCEETSDKEMKDMVENDVENINLKNNILQEKMLQKMLQLDEDHHIDNFYVEVSSGIGGQEAMLFAQEIFYMYVKYCQNNGWESSVVELADTPIGGIRKASLLVNDNKAYRNLKFEGGIHRVQRVPKTEKAGRIHTSAAVVAILPQPSEIDITIAEKDLKTELKYAGGPGGQSVNKTKTAVRMIHLPTGIKTECQISRSQHRNKLEALRKIKVMLYQMKLDEQESKNLSQRKLQVGSRSRSEKIRTYNYPQNRVTDHRLSLTVHNLDDLLMGGQTLKKIVSALEETGIVEKINEIMVVVDRIK